MRSSQHSAEPCRSHGSTHAAAAQRGPRDRIPAVVDQDATARAEPEVVVVERGIAINPRRTDLLAATAGPDLRIRTTEDLRAEVAQRCGGKPAQPALSDEPVAVVKWVDRTALDTVWGVG
jgi:citrate lyase subunit alpha/citrate CoA-transferase